jgi:hypothetical protein
MTRAARAALCAQLLGFPGVPAARAQPAEQTVVVFRDARLGYDQTVAEPPPRNGYAMLEHGQTAQTTVRLPLAPADQRDARRIVASVSVRPVTIERNGSIRPGDPWTRLGGLSVLVPGANAEPVEVELLRFTTGFGGRATFTEDLTPLAPILAGERVMRISISTFLDPGWEVDCTLTWSPDGVGQRRPALAQPLFNTTAVTDAIHRLSATVEIPSGLATPRLRVITTGHANDGTGANEFATSTHIVRIDGVEVARFRPWSEAGGTLRDVNPAAGRQMIDGRWLWSSDLDRSGWAPGSIVHPLLIPVAELTAGTHRVELEILGIRPLSGDPPTFGYWRVSVVVVADGPWPMPTP